MLRLLGRQYRHCDGITRRQVLTAGAFGFGGHFLGGIWLGDLLRAEEAAGIESSNKAIINVHLDGGPPHLDMFDLKPQAPVEIRGEFTPISTSLAGFHICELMPKLSGIAGKLVFIRSLVGSAGAHNAFQCQSGYDEGDLESLGGRPTLGSVVAKLKGQPTDPAPPFVDLMQGRPFVRNSARPGFLGPAFQPFRPDISKMFERELEDGMKNELARLGADHSVSMALHPSLNVDRLNDRTQLLAGLDRLRRRAENSGIMSAMDRFTRQAVGILTSGRLADALDLTKEDPRNLARYTPADAGGERFYTSEGPLAVRKFLLARRLVEAGVRCVSLSISDFDTHADNFPRMRQLLPLVDHGLWALITDLEERGMLNDVTVVAWGEFGRTPRVDAQSGGRHHWPDVGPAILAGGGMHGGQVIGETDRTGSAARARPVHYKDIFATLYHNLGINAQAITVTDPRGRPHYLLDAGEPLREVI